VTITPIEFEFDLKIFISPVIIIRIIQHHNFNNVAYVKTYRLKQTHRIAVECQKSVANIKFIYALNLNDFTVRYCKGHFINDLDNGPDYSMSSDISSNPNQIIDVSTLKLTPDEEALEVKERLFPDNKMPKKLKNIDEFQRLWDQSTEESNPIIQIFKFKK